MTAGQTPAAAAARGVRARLAALPIRLRLTLVFTVAMVLVLALSGLVVFERVRTTVDSQLDLDVSRQASTLLARVAGSPGRLVRTVAHPEPGRRQGLHVAHPYLRFRDGTLADQWIPGYGVSSAVWGPVLADGGLAASSLDVAWFANALFDGRIVGPAALRLMTHIGPGDYGFGLRSRPFAGHDWLGHRGYFGGFEAEDWTDPGRRVTTAVGDDLELVGGQPTSTEIWKALASAYDRWA